MIKETITTKASVEVVFHYLNEARNFIATIPGAQEIEILERQTKGWLFQWRSILSGVQFIGRGECITQHDPHRAVYFILSGGLELEQTWQFEPCTDGTQVTMEIEYTIPTPLKRRHSQEEIAEAYTMEASRILTTLAQKLDGKAIEVVSGD